MLYNIFLGGFTFILTKQALEGFMIIISFLIVYKIEHKIYVELYYKSLDIYDWIDMVTTMKLLDDGCHFIVQNKPITVLWKDIIFYKILKHLILLEEVSDENPKGRTILVYFKNGNEGQRILEVLYDHDIREAKRKVKPSFIKYYSKNYAAEQC